MKRILLTLAFLLLFCTVAFAETVTLQWKAATDNVVVTGYKVWTGNVSETYTMSTNVGNVLTYQVPEMVAGTKYVWVVTAHDAAGNESSYSNEVSHTASGVTPEPPPPVADTEPPSTPLLRKVVTL